MTLRPDLETAIEEERTSLWLHPSDKPRQVDLNRWAEYPYFIEALKQFGTPVMRAQVRWEPYDDFTSYGFDDESDWNFVDDVADRIRAGEDVPPLVREDGEPFDGRHRAWAARRLGIELAPTFTLTYK